MASRIHGIIVEIGGNVGRVPVTYGDKPCGSRGRRIIRLKKMRILHKF